MIKALGYLGLIPFVLLTLMAWWPALASFVTLPAAPVVLFIQYSGLILCLMVGVLWPALWPAVASQKGSDAAMVKQNTARTVWLATLLLLLAWVTQHITPKAGLLLLAAAFCVLWRSEERLGFNKLYLAGYQQLRLTLTLVVVACHGAIWLSVS